MIERAVEVIGDREKALRWIGPPGTSPGVRDSPILPGDRSWAATADDDPLSD